MTDAPGLAWRDAVTALDLVYDARLSLIVRARAGPVRDALLARRDAAVVRITADSDAEALGGGVDVLASIAAGAPVVRSGLAERIAGKVLVVAGAERLPEALAAMVAAVIESREAGVVLLDEGIDTRVAPLLDDRAAMMVDLDGVSIRDLGDGEDDAEGAPLDDPAAALCTVAAALGIDSLRAPLGALTVARAHAQGAITEADAAFAVRVTLAPRARCQPAGVEPPADAATDPASSDEDDGQAAEDRLIEAARAAIPVGLLDAGRRAGAGRGHGSAAARRGGGTRGRPGRVRAGLPRRGARLDLAATLIAAAPMQRLRGRAAGDRLAIRKDDIRVRRPQPKRTAVTIFAVDASGSAAVARLAEVKGAVEQLLAESYVRRDEAALIAFRGEGAETLLPPTRALARAKRALAALPGGGPTPLAAGIVAALDQAIRSRDVGRAPLILLVTDGGANVARDGATGRARATEDAEHAAKLVAAAGIDTLVIDSSPRGQARVERLAGLMAARYVALPRLDDAVLAGLVTGRR